MTTSTRLPEPAYRGKVRDIYDLGEHLLLVASDRVSAFDCILPDAIPDKGRVLTQISLWWFEQMRDIVPHHVVSGERADFPEPFRSEPSLEGRSMLCHKAKRVDVECVVRGYVAGAGWKDYEATGRVFGHDVGTGLTKGARFADPIFTPTTKEDEGHDRPIDFDEMAGITGRDLAERLRDVSLAIFRRAGEIAEPRGFLVADTKFEFGFVDGELTLIDELLTPDSSRYWRRDDYRIGHPPESWDKQVIRDHLDGLDWDKTPPAPALPSAIIDRARERYLHVYEALRS